MTNEAADLSIRDTLTERSNTHGDYSSQSIISQNIKSAMRHTPNWHKLPEDMKESLEMIALKISRILNGDPFYDDHWHDLCGYAQLVLDRIKPIA